MLWAEAEDGSTPATSKGARHTRALKALLLTAIAISLTACAGATDAGPSAPTPPPSAPTSSIDAAEATAACLREDGWDVNVLSGAGISFQPPEGQQQAFFDAILRCDKDLGFADSRGPEVNHELAVSEYAAQVRYRDCLIEQGRTIPELPSFQAFEDDLINHGIITDIGYAGGVGDDDPLRIECSDPMLTWGNNG